MKKINISTPKYPKTFTIVDDKDFVGLNKHKWYPSQRTKNKLYVCRTSFDGGKHELSMHRVILLTPPTKETDHINGNTLDNRRCNLRVCTKSQNQMNRQLSPTNKSGFKGVHWDRYRNKWRTTIKAGPRQRYVASNTCLIKAAVAYDKAAIKHFGEFACLNFPHLLRQQ